MAYFAIHVKSGCERLVASHISQVCQKQSRTDIHKVIVPVTTVIDMTNKNIKQKTKAKMATYIFVSIENSENSEYQEINASVYQFLKSASPYIFKILPYSLSKEECTEFLESINIAEVEILVPNTPPEEIPEIQPQRTIHAYKQLIHHNKLTQKRRAFAKYIQSILTKSSKKITIHFDENANCWKLCSNTQTLMSLFSTTVKTLQDLKNKPLQVLLEIVEGEKRFGKQIINTC